MPVDKKRERAIGLIHSLRLLADHPNTPHHEAEAARGRIKALQDKHNISATPPKTTTRVTSGNTTWGTGTYTTWTRTQETDEETLRRFNEQQKRESEARAKRIKDVQETVRQAREEASARWKTKHANSDDNGQPLTDAERQEAARDPLKWAADHDKRTHDQKQQDLNNSWGQPHTPPPKVPKPKCSQPETFFDRGGYPRKRNEYTIKCDRCQVDLQPGEGTIVQVGAYWVGRCCETVPGPRKKRGQR